MKQKEINKKLQELEEKFRNMTEEEKAKSDINKEYQKLICRETINDYLYYGYGVKTFMEQCYDYASLLTEEDIKQLFREQTEVLGNEEL